MAPRLSDRAWWLTLALGFGLGVLFYAWLTYLRDADDPAKCDYRIARVSGYKWVGPLLSAEDECEAEIYLPLRRALLHQIDSLRQSGILAQASVYLRDFGHGHWMSLNGDERYHPASLMKVALLISMLKAAEMQPGLLQQRIRCTAPPNGVIQPQYYTFPSIEVGKEYTVAELLEHMIVYSDNHATWLLASRLDPQSTPKLFDDIGLHVSWDTIDRFTLSAPEIAVLFKVIFNSSYLRPEFSEYAAQLLSKCAFSEGFKKGLPLGTRLWHKFGGWGHAGRTHELHEAGVIYVEDAPYLLVIMTRGGDTERQAQSIALLTQTVHHYLLQQQPKGGLGAVEELREAAP